MDYREMKKEERDACAELAARAFDDYEYFTVYFHGVSGGTASCAA